VDIHYDIIEGEIDILKNEFPMIFGPLNRGDQLLKALTELIDVQSILIDHPEEADETIKKDRNILVKQIHRKQWVRFFEIIGEFNFTNFERVQFFIFNRSIYNFIQEVQDITLGNQTRDYYKKKCNRNREKQQFSQFLKSLHRGGQLLKILSTLIDIPSIMIDLPEEADKAIKKDRNILDNQICR
jgi:hypothetical protein